MFLEPSFKGQRSGWIEVICGSMFSGKTEELIRRIKRARIANQKTLIFKPITDSRYDKEKVVSHDANQVLSMPISNSNEILTAMEDAMVIGIDEAQFFDARYVLIAAILPHIHIVSQKKVNASFLVKKINMNHAVGFVTAWEISLILGRNKPHHLLLFKPMSQSRRKGALTLPKSLL